MRRLLALALVVAAAAAPSAVASDKVVACFDEHNRIPKPGYGGWVLSPEETVACWLS